MACGCGCNNCGTVKMLSGLSDIVVAPQPSSVISAQGFISSLPVWVWGVAAFVAYKVWR